jgi:hypothetical protein
MKQKIAPKERTEHRKQINGKFNNRGSADENKKITAAVLSFVRC